MYFTYLAFNTTIITTTIIIIIIMTIIIISDMCKFVFCK